jgi:hypothetical protein
VDKSRRYGQMLGDALREIAVLWLALYPLERFKFSEANNWYYMAAVTIAAILLMAGGMFLERKRIVVTITEDPLE